MSLSSGGTYVRSSDVGYFWGENSHCDLDLECGTSNAYVCTWYIHKDGITICKHIQKCMCAINGVLIPWSNTIV